MFYHIQIGVETEKKSVLGTRYYYIIDLTEEGVKSFLEPYRHGIPFTVDKDIIDPWKLTSICIRSTDVASATLIPSLQHKFDREKAERDWQARMASVVAFNPFDHFHAQKSVYYVGSDCTSDFMIPFPGVQKDNSKHIVVSSSEITMRGPMTPEKRFTFLKALYDMAGADPNRAILWLEIGAKAGLTQEESAAAQLYLRQKNLITDSNHMNGITAQGIDEVEKAERNPDQPTIYFPAHVINNSIHIGGNATGVNLMQSSNNSTQTATVQIAGDEAISALRGFISSARSSLGSTELSEDDKESVEAGLNSLQAQADETKPNPKTIRGHLRNFKLLLENLATGVASSVIAQPLLLELHHLIPKFM